MLRAPILVALAVVVPAVFAMSCTQIRSAHSRQELASAAPTSTVDRLEPMSQFVFDEDFVGPFPSWKSIRDFGAKGDGLHDDTASIQRGLDALRTIQANTWSVLYFPAGQYRITGTVATRRDTHQDYLGGSIVGEDPATTAIVWDGPAGQDMIHYDGWYTKVSRFTFNGSKRARIGLYRGDAFSTFNELSDLVFQDLEVGIRLGGGIAHGLAQGQAEHAIVRNVFRRCSRAGVLTSDWNSLDNWIVFSRFEDCGFGLYNATGNFHAWRNVFLRSSTADISSVNLGLFSFVENVSVGSKSFIDWTRAHSWGAQVLVQGNRIYDVTGTAAIITGSAGPFLVLDNVIRNRERYGGPSILLSARDQILMGNRQTGAAGDGAEVQTEWAHGAMRVHRFGNVGMGRSAIEPPDLVLPPTPPARRRKVFELPLESAGGADVLQKLVDAASREPLGSHPVVHIPKGNISIDHTITVPAGRDIQIVGDGASDAGSRLNWTGQGPGPMFTLAGPSRTVLRDFAIYGGCDGVVIKDANQVGGRIFADQLNVSGAGGPERGPMFGIYLDGIDDSDVTLTCSNVSNTWNNVLVRGGAKRSRGERCAGQTSVLMGSSSNAGRLYDVQNGGELLAAAVWYEGGFWASATHIKLQSTGSLTLAMLQLASVPDTANPFIRVKDYRGVFSLIGSQLSPTETGRAPVHAVRVEGSTENSRVYVLANAFMNVSDKPVDVRSLWKEDSRHPGATSFIQNDQFGSFAHHFEALPDLVSGADRSSSQNRAFVDGLQMLRAVRFQPAHVRARGVTDVRIHRLQIQAGVGRTGLAARH